MIELSAEEIVLLADARATPGFYDILVVLDQMTPDQFAELVPAEALLEAMGDVLIRLAELGIDA